MHVEEEVIMVTVLISDQSRKMTNNFASGRATAGKDTLGFKSHLFQNVLHLFMFKPPSTFQRSPEGIFH